MVARIQTIDTAISSFRTFITAASPAASRPLRSASSTFRINATKPVSQDNETTARLRQLQHSSVSQNIAQLLLFSTTSTPLAAPSFTRIAEGGVLASENSDRVGRVRGLLQKGGEVGAKELARAGLVGGHNQESRRFELSL